MIETTRRPRQYVDFNKVPPSQWKMHDRLLDWARASRGGDKQSGACAPMFSSYRSNNARDREYGAATVVPVNRPDAELLNAGVAALPDQHRKAIHWYYVHRGSRPKAQADSQGVTMEKLAELVIEGRYGLIDMGV